MVSPSAGDVVLVPFPFSDLSQSRLRPAVVLAAAGRGDWILCQVTSNPYSGALDVAITATDFRTGSLRSVSYARPGKLFTADQGLMVAHVGSLTDEAFGRVLDAVLKLLEAGRGPGRVPPQSPGARP